jgi:hypothetical protein
MKTEALNLAPIIQRLTEKVEAKQIGGAAKYASATTDTKAVPALFVIPLADNAGPNKWANGVEQKVKTTFGVIIGTRDLSDGKGAAAQDELGALRKSVLDALLGWCPDGCSNAITYNGGRLIDFINGIVWWQDDFDTSYEIGD